VSVFAQYSRPRPIPYFHEPVHVAHNSVPDFCAVQKRKLVEYLVSDIARNCGHFSINRQTMAPCKTLFQDLYNEMVVSCSVLTHVKTFVAWILEADVE